MIYSKSRVVLSPIRLFPTISSKMKWIACGLPLKFLTSVHTEIMNYILEQKYKPNIDAGGMPPNKGMIMDYLYDNPQVFKNNLLARGLLTLPARVPSLYINLIKWDASSRWSLSLYCLIRNSDPMAIAKMWPTFYTKSHLHSKQVRFRCDLTRGSFLYRYKLGTQSKHHCQDSSTSSNMMNYKNGLRLFLFMKTMNLYRICSLEPIKLMEIKRHFR